ncbi:GNAT family N-acetyltransferase [Candidatus Bipolaricaulota bacterium]
MSSITFRELSRNEVVRVREIDRTERVRVGYRFQEGRLIRMDVVWDSSPWREDGGEHSFPHMISFLDEVVSHEGTMLGAFSDDRLVGIAAFRPHLTETMAQLAFLHVSNGYRRQGIASRLFDQVEELARQSAAQELYVSATSSESAVGFYSSRGFALTPDPHPELLELEPEDIHMIKRL